jgi:hypothetical protein
MAWRHKNRWFRRWLIVIIFWAVPVMIVAVNEIREELAYDSADMDRTLRTWTLTDAQRAGGAAVHCQGLPDEARAAGCPAGVLTANATAHQDAIDEYTLRRNVLFAYLWHAFVGYWVVPAVFLFCLGAVLGVVRRSLRRPDAKSGTAAETDRRSEATHGVKP